MNQIKCPECSGKGFYLRPCRGGFACLDCRYCDGLGAIWVKQ